jgi:hypothetical protein
MTLETHLKKHLAELEEYRDEYKKALEDPTNVEKFDFFNGKYHAYRWAVENFKDLLRFHGVIQP